MLDWKEITNGVPTVDGQLCLLYSSFKDHCIGPVKWDAKAEAWRDDDGKWATYAVGYYLLPDDDFLTHWAEWNSPFDPQQVEEGS